MNDAWERFEQLAAGPAGRTAPRVDVVDGVLTEIRRRSLRRPPELPWLVLSGTAACAAALAGVALLQIWHSLSDPLIGLLEPLRMVMQ